MYSLHRNDGRGWSCVLQQKDLQTAHPAVRRGQSQQRRPPAQRQWPPPRHRQRARTHRTGLYSAGRRWTGSPDPRILGSARGNSESARTLRRRSDAFSARMRSTGLKPEGRGGAGPGRAGQGRARAFSTGRSMRFSPVHATSTSELSAPTRRSGSPLVSLRRHRKPPGRSQEGAFAPAGSEHAPSRPSRTRVPAHWNGR